ncbi:TRAP transporter small permease [Pseudorhodoferax sp. LjRoot39]|uniref:TRAP transporter small permease n=1 Tax=Pseudorhodoferax sp. LjRoot39 TaxID=3342328 RepID=UPI003ECF313B
MRALANVVDALARATRWTVQALTLLMLAALALQVLMRSAFNAPPSWSEEVALLAFSWTALLGLAYGVREGIHVRMDMLLDALPQALRRWAERLVLAAVASIGLYLAVAGWHYTQSAVGTSSAAIGYPMPLLYASCVVCGVLVAVFGTERLLRGLPVGGEADAAP